MADSYRGVNALCEILGRCPDKSRYDLINWACLSLGLVLESTGLERGQGRLGNSHYWDLTVDDLRKRLVRLISETGVMEQVAAGGVIAFLISFYRRESDPNKRPGVVRKHCEVIEGLEYQLSLSVSQRKDNMSDEELENSMTEAKDILHRYEARRQDTEEALGFLQQETKDTFTDELWGRIMSDERGRPQRRRRY